MKDFLKIVFGLALPIALQNLINTGVTTADVVMLGMVGETALSSGSLAGQVQFVMNLVIFGMTSGASVLSAQYWGKREISTIEKIFSMTLSFALIAGLLFMMAGQLFPEALMHIFSSEEEIIANGVSYLKIVSWSYPLSAFSSGYLYLMRSIERVKIATVVYACSLVINVILNGIFIFGFGSIPAMGITGAALATFTARIFEFLAVMFYILKVNKEVRIHLKNFIHLDSVLLKDFVVLSIPVVMNETLWGAGMSANAAILGQLGSSAAAANSVVRVIRELIMVMCMGLSSATAVLVGKALGEKQMELAKTYAKRMLALSFGITTVISITIFSLRHVIVNSMALGTEAKGYLEFMMLILLFYSMCQSITCPIIVGVLRGGGDTRFGLVLEACSLWGGAVLLAWVGAFVLHLPMKVIFILLMIDEFIKLPFSFWRYRTNVWLKNLTR